MTEQSIEDRVAALERGMAALTERVERLEAEMLPREVAGWKPVVDPDDVTFGPGADGP